MSHLFRQQHLAPHRPTFHRHKETRHYERQPDVAKMKLVDHHHGDYHITSGHLLPPVSNLVSSDDHRGNQEHVYSSTDSEFDDVKQLTEDDRQCVNEIRRAQWQPQQLSLVEQEMNDSRADSVLYEYHLSQPTTVSVDNTTLPTVHWSNRRKKTTNACMTTVQQQYKLLPPPTNSLSSNNQDALTTKQLLNKTVTTSSSSSAAAETVTIAHHKDRIAQAVELAAAAAANSCSEDTASSKVAEIRLVFDNSPPSQPHVMGMPMMGSYKVDYYGNRSAHTANRPHTTDCGSTGRPLFTRKPSTRTGMRPIPENTGMCIMDHVM